MQSTAGTNVTESLEGVRQTGEITAWLRQLPNGDAAVVSRIMRALYCDLKRVAVRRMRNERPDHTLDPEALISELFLRLARTPDLHFRSRGHFLAFAAQQMRHFLVDYARAHRSEKRNGRREKVRIEDCGLVVRHDFEQVLSVDELLEKLAIQEPRMAKVVEMRCFGGFTHAEIAETLGMDERTAKRDWSFARAWLESALRKGAHHAHHS